MKDKSFLTTKLLIKKEHSIKAGEIRTGFRDIDMITGGFLPGELICIAGRHSMGATGLALGILNSACVKEKKTCLYFALAENGRDILTRLAADVSRDQDILRPEHKNKFKDTLKKIERSPLYINETAFLAGTIESTCKKMNSRTPVDLVIVDYHQLVRTGKEDDRSLVSARLKKIARSIGCPVIVLCQLDKSIDLREDRRPVLSDLRSIGETDNYADKVLLLYREDYYNINTGNAGKAEVFIAKNNNGRSVSMVSLLHKGGGIFVNT